MTNHATLPQPLGDGLTLRAVNSPEDVQRYIDVNARVTNEGDIAQRLLHHHPTTTHADYWLVVDETTGQAVSTTCLLPWRCQLDGVALDVAMLEMVVTDPAYRKRGLVRAQIEHFHKVVAERGFDLSIIQGIPYYYRQFGYAYAIDHTPLTRLVAWQIPDIPAENSARYRWRPATVDDVAVLEQLYTAAMGQHHLSVERSAAEWRYLLQHKAHPVRLFEEAERNRAVGYIVPSRTESPFRLYEHALQDPIAGLPMLALLKAECGGELQLAGPASDRLVGLAQTLGGVTLPVADQWLWRIPDVGTLLTKLTPLFAHRLQAGGYGDYMGKLCINLYRSAFWLQIDRGQLRVESAGFVDASLGASGGDLNLPPAAFVRLLLGYRTLETLMDAWPDIRVKPATRNLLDCLFPIRNAHILMPY